MAALAPMPSASVTITVMASPCVRLSELAATRRSRRNDILAPLESPPSDPPATTSFRLSAGRQGRSGDPTVAANADAWEQLLCHRGEDHPDRSSGAPTPRGRTIGVNRVPGYGTAL